MVFGVGTKKKNTGMWADNSIIEEPINPTVAPFIAQEKRAKRIRRYVTFAVYGTPLFLLIAVFGIALGVSESADTPTVSVVEGNRESIVRQNTARVSLDRWMASDIEPLPGGRVVGFDREEPNVAIGDVSPDSEVTEMFTEMFTVVDANGNLYEAAVGVSVYRTGVIGASSDVSLTPYTYQVSNTNEGWLGQHSPDNVDDKVVEVAVGAWADALYSGDGALVKNAVGDTVKTHTYIPMPLAQVSTEVVDMSTVTNSEELIVARVNVVVDWLDEENRSYLGDKDSVRVTYDVLLEGAYEGSARVVAWGGAGQAGVLQAYCNAVDGEIDLVGVSHMGGWKASEGATNGSGDN